MQFYNTFIEKNPNSEKQETPQESAIGVRPQRFACKAPGALGKRQHLNFSLPLAQSPGTLAFHLGL
jgi:hypothetical protein